MDVHDASTADGSRVSQWTRGDGTDQQFRLADSDGGHVRLINRNSGKAVEVQGASTADGANVVQRPRARLAVARCAGSSLNCA